jgi:hypothetical protein
MPSGRVHYVPDSGANAGVACDGLNAGYLYLEVKCLGCKTHQTVALDIVRRRKATPIHRKRLFSGLVAAPRP